VDDEILVQRQDLIEVFKALSMAVVSLDRLGSYRASITQEQWEHEVADWTLKSDVTRKLLRARWLLDPYFSHDLGEDEMDELERACADLPYWRPPAR